jgi:hypothetical protein
VALAGGFVHADDKVVLGAAEYVSLAQPPVTLVARIDTGATASSLDAREPSIEIRDGREWVRFELGDTRNVMAVPVMRWVKVVSQADTTGTRRAVVAIPIRVGSLCATTEFTLADRRHLEYPMILGRQFLRGRALVDVEREFVQPAANSSCRK